jgi:ATP-dependent RNA helicase DeaD
MPEIYRKLEWLSKEDLIKRVVSHEFNRFEEYYRGKPEIESPSDGKGGDRGGRRDGKGQRTAEAGYTRLFINLGKTDGFMPNELITLLNNNTRGRIDLGRIDLMKNYSFFEVDEKETKTVLRALNRVKWNGRRVIVEVTNDDNAVKGKKRDNDSSQEGRSNKAKGKNKDRGNKPSREERGYTKARGKKDDWKKFFESPEPDFSEEGWAKRTNVKK